MMKDPVYAGLLDHPGHFYASYRTGSAKPKDAAYLEVLNDSLFTPSQAIFVDDRQDNVDGAAACGIYPFLFDYKHPESAVAGIITYLKGKSDRTGELRRPVHGMTEPRVVRIAQDTVSDIAAGDDGGYIVNRDTLATMYYGERAREFLDRTDFFGRATQVIIPEGAEAEVSQDGYSYVLNEPGGFIIGPSTRAKVRIIRGHALIIVSDSSLSWYKRFGASGQNKTGIVWERNGIIVIKQSHRRDYWKPDQGTEWITDSTVKGEPLIGVSRVSSTADSGATLFTRIRPAERFHVHPVREGGGKQAEVYLVTKGLAAMTFMRNGIPVLEYLHPGDMVAVEPGTIHEILAVQTPYEHLVIQIPTAFQYGLLFKEDIAYSSLGLSDLDMFNLGRRALERIDEIQTAEAIMGTETRAPPVTAPEIARNAGNIADLFVNALIAWGRGGDRKKEELALLLDMPAAQSQKIRDMIEECVIKPIRRIHGNGNGALSQLLGNLTIYDKNDIEKLRDRVTRGGGIRSENIIVVTSSSPSQESIDVRFEGFENSQITALDLSMLEAEAANRRFDWESYYYPYMEAVFFALLRALGSLDTAKNPGLLKEYQKDLWEWYHKIPNVQVLDRDKFISEFFDPDKSYKRIAALKLVIPAAAALNAQDVESLYRNIEILIRKA
ncbi:MAG: HAD-IA family hydrolase, partial [Candidatus Omnitrophota bacterium]